MKANFYKFESAKRGMQKGVGVIVGLAVLLVVAGIYVTLGGNVTGSVVTGSAVQEGATCGTYAVITPSSAEASSILSGNFDASKAVDGNGDTRWVGNTSLSYPQWIVVDLGEKKCIKSLDLNLFNFSTPLTMNIQVSDDKNTWTSATDGWQVTQERVYVNKAFSEVHARYVRLYQTAGPVNSAGSAAEIRVNAAPEVAPVKPATCTKASGMVNVTNSTGSFLYKDVCTDATHLNEYVCNAADVSQRTVVCSEGCAQDACTKTVSSQIVPEEGSETQEQQSTPSSTTTETPQQGIVANEREVAISCGAYEETSPRDATAISQFHNFRPVNAIDEDVNTHWFGDPKEAYPKWISFDLGVKKCVRAVEANIFLWDAPLTATIEISDDGNTWTTLAEEWVIEDGGRYARREFDAVQTRYLRFLETSGKRSYGTVSEFLVDAAPIEEKVTEKAKLFTENVLGGSAPERYYLVGGEKVYLEIDGEPVAEYVAQ